MKSNRIKLVSIVGSDKLFFIIEYEDGDRKSFALDDPQLQPVKSYLQNQGKQSVSQGELQAEVKSSQSNKNKTIYWIFGGIVVVLLAVVGILVYFLSKKRKEEN